MTPTAPPTTAPTPAGVRWGLARRRLYLCTPDRPDLESFVGRCIAGGVDMVQLREKRLDDTALVARAALAQRVCAAAGVPFVLNDRPDLAAAIGADGVHVGQDDMSAAEARTTVGDDTILGLSTHSPDELAAATGAAGTPGPAPVDYLSAGPVVATPTKPGRTGTGPGYVARAVGESPWPVWVTGGVDPESVGDLVAIGARHFVVVRWLVGADDPEGAARQLRARIDDLLADRPD
ncbi:MAG TPA: thiamine phosphate synthase [Acidimicrobiales bacterium]